MGKQSIIVQFKDYIQPNQLYQLLSNQITFFNIDSFKIERIHSIKPVIQKTQTEPNSHSDYKRRINFSAASDKFFKR
jgi:hypothetical protein